MNVDRVADLTPRQLECLCALLSNGMERPQAALSLGITDGTLEQHLKAARATLGVGSTKQAVALAAMSGRCGPIQKMDIPPPDIGGRAPPPPAEVSAAGDGRTENELTTIQRVLVIGLIALLAAILTVPLLGSVDWGMDIILRLDRRISHFNAQ